MLGMVELNQALNRYAGELLLEEEFRSFETFVWNRWKNEDDWQGLDLANESKLWNQERRWHND